MTWRGQVEWVETVTPRGFLAAAATTGATTLTLYGGLAFATDQTGSVTIDGGTYTYSGLVLSADESVTPSSLTISPGLTADADEGDPVALVTDSETKIAGVSTGDGIGDVLSVRVPHGLIGYTALTDGTFDEGDQPTVDVERVDGELVVKNVVGQTPVFDGAVLASGSVPSTSIDDSFLDGITITADQVRSEAGVINSFQTDMGLLARLLVGDYIVLDGTNSTLTLYADTAHTQPLVQLNPNGAVVRGTIISENVNILDSLVLQGVLSRVANNAIVTLANGVGDPKTPPALTQAWEQVPFVANSATYMLVGLCDSPTAGYYTRLLWKIADKQAYIQVIEIATGTATLTLLGDVPGFTEDMFSGIVYLGGYYYCGVMNYNIAGEDHVFLVKFDATTGAYVGQMVVTGYPTAGTDRSSTAVRLGVDYVNNLILVGTSISGDTLGACTTSLTPATGPVVRYSTPTGEAPLFVGFGPFDYGANRWIAQLGTRSQVVSGTSSTGLSDTGDAAFPALSGARIFWHAADSKFYLLSGSNFYRLGSYAAAETWWAQYADTDATHTTAASPKTSLMTEPRKIASVQLPPASPSTTGSDVFVGYGSTSPTNSNMFKRAETLTGRSLTLTGGKVTSGANPPTSSTFGTGTAGLIESESGAAGIGGDSTMWAPTPTLAAHVANKSYTDGLALASTRTSLASFITGATVTPGLAFDIRSVGKWREIRGSVNFTIANATTTTITTALNSGDRPTTNNAFGNCYLAGGFAGEVFIRPAGTIAITNQSGASRTGDHQFTIIYTVD